MTDLAIDGGEPAIPGGLDPEWPVFDGSDRDELLEVLEDGRWSSADFYFEDGPSKVRQFEERFAAFVGTEYATAVPNGTQALELACKAVGVRPGDEVIVPAATFLASAAAVAQVGGVPVFVDVDPDTYQLSPDAVEDAVTDRTVAIEAVHYGGYPADMDRIRQIADDHGLSVIEDAAEAHGTEWRGESVGSIGDIGCFSLQLGKPLTCGEGGVVTYDDGDLARRIDAFAGQGREPRTDGAAAGIPPGDYRLSEFLGGLLCAQLSRLDDQTDRRERNGELLAERIAAVDGVSTLKSDQRVTRRGYYFYFARFDPAAWPCSRDEFLTALDAEGVPCSTAHNDPLYDHPEFAQLDASLVGGHAPDYGSVSCPAVERIYESEVVALPNTVLLAEDDARAVAGAFEKLGSNRGALGAE